MGTKPSSKTFGALCMAAAVCAFAPAANASSVTNTIYDITIEGTQFARIAMNSAPISGRPWCHNAAYKLHYQWDISTAKGQAMLTAAQGAQLSGKKVSAWGGTTCTTANTTLETLTSLTVWTN